MVALQHPVHERISEETDGTWGTKSCFFVCCTLLSRGVAAAGLPRHLWCSSVVAPRCLRRDMMSSDFWGGRTQAGLRAVILKKYSADLRECLSAQAVVGCV